MKPLAPLLLGTLLAGAASAQTLSCSALSRIFGDGGASVLASNVDSSAPSCISAVSAAGGFASGNAQVALGVLKIDSYAELADTAVGFPFPSADARVSAGWVDSFTINAPGFGNNKFGQLSFSVTVSGFIDSFAPPNVSQEGNRAFWNVTAGGGSGGGVSAAMSPSGGFDNSMLRLDGDFQQGWNLVLSGVINFRFNTPTSLGMDLALQTRAIVAGGSVTGAFGNSAYWGGITSVKDPNGNLLTLAAPGQAAAPGQYSMSTLSGIDWHPSMVPPAVPEPGSALLLLLGLPWLLARRAGGAGFRAAAAWRTSSPAWRGSGR